MRTTTMAIAVLGMLAPPASSQNPPSTRAPGVLVRLYKIGPGLAQLPELVTGELPNAVLTQPALDLSVERGGFGELKNNFAAELTGFLAIPKAGPHTFRLISDDGAKLWIAGRLVVDHDGLHGAVAKDGTIDLASGPLALRIWYFQGSGGAQLTLLWKPPGAADFAPVPAEVLSHDPPASMATAPGVKRIIPPLRRGLPGDGSPLAKMHPSFIDVAEMDDFRPRVLTEWIDTGRLREMGRPWRATSETPQAWLPASAGPEGVYDHLAALDDPPYRGQLVVLPNRRGEALRICQDVRVPQACVFRFGLVAPTQTTPDGAIAFQMVNPPPFELLAVRALGNGLELEFTRPLDARVGWEADSYYVEQWPFDFASRQPPARDGSALPVKSASVSPDRQKVFLEIEGLKPRHVVYVRLLPPCLSEDGQLPWSTEAWYTLNEFPKEPAQAAQPPSAALLGKVLPRPPQPPQNVLTEAERAAGWRLLFDGQTTKGWHGWKRDAFPDGWKVIDGCLARVGPGGDIVTDEEFGDFELALEWRISAAGNSGIFFRASERDPFKWCWETAPEFQVLDNAEHADGREPKTSAGSNYALHAPVRDATQPVGLFNQVRILVDGRHVEHWLNGEQIVAYDLGSPEWEQLVAGSKFAKMPHYGRTDRGRIVLQDHGDKVWYRNIKIRPLPGR